MNAMSRFALAFAVAILGMAPSFAFTMEPMSVLLAPSGPGSVATFRIANDGETRIALRLSVWARGVGPEGEETRSQAEDRFVLYPSRLVVEAGASATVKLQWRGEAHPVAEIPFRLIAEQVPLDASPESAGKGTTPKASGIKVLFRYIASVYIGDASFTPNVSATVVGTTSKEGRPGFIVNLSNWGTRHVVVNTLRVDLSGTGGPTLEGAQVQPLSGINYLPGTGRSLFVPYAEAVPGAIYEAKTSFDTDY